MCFDKRITSELSKMSSLYKDYNLHITDNFWMPLLQNILTEQWIIILTAELLSLLTTLQLYYKLKAHMPVTFVIPIVVTLYFKSPYLTFVSCIETFHKVISLNVY